MDRSHRPTAVRCAVAFVGFAAATLVSFSDAEARSSSALGADPWSAGRGTARGVYGLYPPNLFFHNVGVVQVEVTNLGFIGNPYHDAYNFGWRGGEYLFAAGLWVGALASDNLPHVSTALVPDGMEFRPRLEPGSTIYRSYEGAPSGNRLGFGSGADDDGDGRTDEDFLDGRDNDGDGRIDEDYEAVSQQMFSCEYRDDTVESIEQNFEHRPLGLHVEQRSLAWGAAGSNEFIGLDYKITNAGREILRNVYVGLFVDADAGPKAHPNYWTDDLSGTVWIDTTLVDPADASRCSRYPVKMGLAYVYDTPDDGEAIIGGDVPGYFGTLVLGADWNVALLTGGRPYPFGDPDTDLERYDLLRGGAGRAPDRAPRDCRWIVSAGPFAEIRPDSSLAFRTCLVVGLGYDGLIQNALGAKRILDGQYVDADLNPFTGTYGRETCIKALPDGTPVEWIDPCDSSAAPVRFTDAHCTGSSYVDNDCNECTGINGKETSVHWVGTVAPSAPSTNVESEFRTASGRNAAGDLEVTLRWDNASELRADPLLRRIVFEGYRVWRADGWNRPLGSMGPVASDWQLIGYFERHPTDGLGAASPHRLAAIVDSTAARVDMVETGDPVTPILPRYEIGRYSFTDDKGLKNGMIYFYDVTAFSRWKVYKWGIVDHRITIVDSVEYELGGNPSAVEADEVIPRWDAAGGIDETIVVPNPYVFGRQPAGWDLTPSDSDPTGARIAFARLPEGKSTIHIYTLAGDLVRTLDHDSRTHGGTEFWNLVTRSGQNVTSGVYLYTVESGKGTKRGRFVIVR